MKKKLWVSKVYAQFGELKVSDIESVVMDIDPNLSLPRICPNPGEPGETYVTEDLNNAAAFVEGAKAILKLII